MDWNQKRVLVTGGGGFIGSHLVTALAQKNAQVTVVDSSRSKPTAFSADISERLTLVPRALSEWLQTDELARGAFDYVFHMAANAYVPPSVENPRFDFEANVLNTFGLLEALRVLPHPPRLVNTSSAAVYGNPKVMPIREDSPLDPISPYGVSKLTGERYAAVYAQLYGMRVSSVRPFSVYGPGQRKQVVYDLIHKLRTDPTHLQVYGDGSQARDFIFVTDMVNAMLVVAECAPGEGEAINVASGTAYTIADLVTGCSRALGVDPIIEYTGHVRPGDAEKWQVEITTLRELGFRPQVNLAQGIEIIRDWYDANEH